LGIGGFVPRSDLAIGTHTITAMVVDSGGLQGESTITIIVTPPPPATDGRTKSDIPVSGTVTGTHKRTQDNDLRYEMIEEIKSNGTQFGRYSFLDHRWSIDVPNISGTRRFHIKAYHSVSVDGDDFTFEYSTNGIAYTPMLTVTRTVDDGTFQTFSLPAYLTGKVYIRTRDTDRTTGHKQPDTLFVDQMFIRVQ
jgi:hypothetical protein